MEKKLICKIIIGAFAAAMSLALLGGCGDGARGGKNGSKSSETAIDKDLDLEGYEFVFASHWSADIFPEKGSSATADLIWQRVEEIQTRNKCTITIKGGTPDQYLQNMEVAAATGIKYADVVLTNLWWYRGYQDTGYFLPWEDIEAVDLKSDKWIQSLMSVTRELDGKIYGIDYTSWPNRILDIDNVLFFNKDLLKRYNQPNPYELEKKNEWTWEALRSIAKSMTKDTDGDKTNDIWGMVSNDRVLEYSAIRSNGCTELKVDSKGLYTLNFQNSKAYKAMELIRDMIHTDKSVFDVFELSSTSLFRDKKAAFLAFGTVGTHWTGYLNEMEEDFGMIWFPQGPDNRGGKKYSSGLSGDTQVFSITMGAEDPQKAGYIFNLLTEPLEGKTKDSWKKSCLDDYFRGDQQAFDNYIIMRDAATFDFGPILGYGSYNSLRDSILDVTRKQSMTPAQAMESVAGAINTQLQERWDLTVGAEE